MSVGFQEIRYLIIGSSFVQMTVKVLVTVIALALGARLLGYAVAVVAASFATFMWLGFGVLRRLRAVAHLSPKTDAPGRWIRFAAISYATSVVSLPASYLDRFLLGYFVGAGPVGVLAVAKQLQQLPLVIYQMLLSVSAPMLAAAHARGARSECDRIYALTTDWAVKAAIPLVLFLGLLAYPVLALFGHAFAEQGTPALRIFVVAQLVNLATGPNGSVATMCGLEKEAFRIDLTTTVGTALLMLLLVPLLGLVGASFAVLFNAVVHSLWLLRLVRNNLGIRWWHARYLEWLLPAVASAATAIALTCIVPRWNAPMLGVALCGMYLVFVSAVFVQGLNSDDRALLLHVVSRCKALIGMGDLSR